mmetsp:Transcript_94436/g.267007  ORF Transcript_94436/g.267007 Transcript_94436/m.267007 type:complete len:432 (+) Transcript_94436:426-1721(+)
MTMQAHAIFLCQAIRIVSQPSLHADHGGQQSQQEDGLDLTRKQARITAQLVRHCLERRAQEDRSEGDHTVKVRPSLEGAVEGPAVQHTPHRRPAEHVLRRGHVEPRFLPGYAPPLDAHRLVISREHHAFEHPALEAVLPIPEEAGGPTEVQEHVGEVTVHQRVDTQQQAGADRGAERGLAEQRSHDGGHKAEQDPHHGRRAPKQEGALRPRGAVGFVNQVQGICESGHLALVALRFVQCGETPAHDAPSLFGQALELAAYQRRCGATDSVGSCHLDFIIDDLLDQPCSDSKTLLRVLLANKPHPASGEVAVSLHLRQARLFQEGNALRPRDIQDVSAHRLHMYAVELAVPCRLHTLSSLIPIEGILDSQGDRPAHGEQQEERCIPNVGIPQQAADEVRPEDTHGPKIAMSQHSTVRPRPVGPLLSATHLDH